MVALLRVVGGNGDSHSARDDIHNIRCQSQQRTSPGGVSLHVNRHVCALVR